MKKEASLGRRGVGWRGLLICWTLIAALFTIRNIVQSVSGGQSIRWGPGVLFEAIYWYTWALLTPFIFWFARHFRLERKERLRSVTVLLLLGLFIAPLQVSLEIAINLTLASKLFHMPAAQIAQRVAGVRRVVLVESFTSYFTYMVVVAAHYAFDYYQKYRERDLRALELEGRLTQAELQNLKMQLHPHFLFNTLNTISVLMIKDTRAANRVLVRLSELLRMALDNVSTQEVSLKEELDFLARYLEIEQTRFEDRLTVRMKIEPGVRDARVPNLILQPLVENAIRHGIAPLLTPGIIEISAYRENVHLRLEVRDNGSGLADSNQHLREGVGLSNTRARLVQLYAKDHTFEAGNAPGGGLLVTIVIPFRRTGGDTADDGVQEDAED
jgi:signal transduction histidine kinase